jgi:small GTP-binding protein
MRSLKVVIIGDTKVGKSCILTRFDQNKFDRDRPATIGAAFLPKVVSTPEGGVRLQLWDTAGQEQFRSLSPMYYRATAAAVLVFDITSRSTLESLSDWKAELVEKAPPSIQIIVVGNKSDLADERVVSETEATEVADSLGARFYTETSALSGDGIEDLFKRIAEIDPAEEQIFQMTNLKPGGGEEPSQCSC